MSEPASIAHAHSAGGHRLHAEGQAHAHSHAHKHKAPVRVAQQPVSSVLLMSFGQRLVAVGFLLAVLWAAVLWAVG